MPNHTNQTIQTERQAVLVLCISSGVKEAGQLELPQPLDEVSRQMDMISEKAGPDSSLYVRSVKSLLPSLNWHLQHIKLDNNSALQQLNHLAEAIERMNAAERYHLSKSLNTEFRQNLDDVLQIAAHIKTSSMDCYEVIPGVTSHQDLRNL